MQICSKTIQQAVTHLPLLAAGGDALVLLPPPLHPHWLANLPTLTTLHLQKVTEEQSNCRGSAGSTAPSMHSTNRVSVQSAFDLCKEMD